MTSRRALACLAILIIIAGGIALIGIWIIYPLWLTQQYGPEVRKAVQRYEDTLTTIDGWTDPSVMAQVATGKRLEFLIKYRCLKCSRVQVSVKTNVEILRVREYSPSFSLVEARVERGWHWVSPSTGSVDGPCHADAFTNIYPLVQEDSIWKVTDAEYWIDLDPNRLSDTPELRAKYCGTN